MFFDGGLDGLDAVEGVSGGGATVVDFFDVGRGPRTCGVGLPSARLRLLEVRPPGAGLLVLLLLLPGPPGSGVWFLLTEVYRRPVLTVTGRPPAARDRWTSLLPL